MIGGLQGDFGDLDIKYLKKNISKCRSHISGSFRRTPRHYAKSLQNSPGKRYQRIQICLTGEVETPSFPIRRQALDVKYPKSGAGCEISGEGGTSPDQNSECEISGEDGTSQGWPSACAWCRDPSGATPFGFPKRTSLSGATPSGFLKRARGACEHHTPER